MFIICDFIRKIVIYYKSMELSKLNNQVDFIKRRIVKLLRKIV